MKVKIRVGLTGGRDFTDIDMLWEFLSWVRDHFNFTLVVGDCPTGADRFAQLWAVEHKITTEMHIADWETYGRAAGPLRNTEMVKSGMHVLIAFPGGRGTLNCIASARKLGIPVVMLTDMDSGMKAEVWNNLNNLYNPVGKS